MKKIIAIIMAVLMMFAMVACSNNTDDSADTVGAKLLADFQSDASGSAQDIADRIIQNEVIQFMGTTMPVEEGFLVGFDETEIKGFKEGVMFAPMIGTIPFVGYIFTLDDSADVEGFKTTLKDSANLCWNICTQAEELVVESEGNTVFFVMCPTTFEEAPADDGADVGGMEIAPDDAIPAEDGITLE